MARPGEGGSKRFSFAPDAAAGETDESAAAEGGEALVAQVLELLATFIGEALTWRLVQQIWPKLALDAPKSGGKT